jgi:1-acyl-sn-glycerol-3-phosphate acyltransferase
VSVPSGSRSRGAAAVAAGAARASGERRRRRVTPLIDAATTESAQHTQPADRLQQTEPTEPTEPTKPTKPPLEQAAEQAPQPTSGREPAAVVRYLVEAVVDAVVAEGRRAGVDDIDQRVATALAFLRRRLTGDYVVDDLGFDAELTEALLPVLRPLYRSWFRVEVRGIENVPATGGALVVANHSGAIALDAVMTQLAVHDEHPAHRHLRLLGADLVFALPVVGELARKTGTTLASNADAERLLRAGELVGVWPEGFKGIGKPFSERYKLQRFGRGGFVSAALAAKVPIVPCSIVGAEEIYPVIGNMKTLARLLGLPYLPVTPTFPWLGLLGLVPLPSKWIIEFGAPIDTTAHTVSPAVGSADAFDGREASDDLGDTVDPMVVFDLTDQVRETIQQTLYALLMQRRSVFF